MVLQKIRCVFEFVKTAALLRNIGNIQFSILGTFGTFANSGRYLHKIDESEWDYKEKTFSPSPTHSIIVKPESNAT